MQRAEPSIGSSGFCSLINVQLCLFSVVNFAGSCFLLYREECLALREPLCYEEWLKIENEKSLGLNVSGWAHFRLPQCEALPSLRPNNSVCSYADLFEITPDKITSKWQYTLQRSLVTVWDVCHPCRGVFCFALSLLQHIFLYHLLLSGHLQLH